MNYDVIIVGAGVAGLMTAIELGQSGAKCCVLDRSTVGSESSWAGGGILSPLYPWNYPDAVNAMALWSQRQYPDYFSQLQACTGIDPQWLTCGHLILDGDLPSARIQAWQEQFEIDGDYLSAPDLLKIEPGLETSFKQGLWLPGIGQVRNPLLIKALDARARELGITIIEHTAVESILQDNHRATGVKTSSEAFSADQVLIAAGAWSGLPLSGIQMPAVEPVKGQMIQFQTAPGTLRCITLYNDHYVIPRRDGKVLCGSTLEYSGFDKSTHAEVAEQLRQIAIGMFPVLQTAPLINHWAGLRPGNQRQTPFVGPHPDLASLFFNSGHFRNGIILGYASARLCADLMLGRPPILEPSDYALF